jgi:hypothetical protein
MFPKVIEHVHQSVPDLARRLQGVRVISLGPDGPMATQGAVDRLRGAYRQTLHTAGQPRRCVRLHEQVKMIGLDAELKNPEHVPGCVTEGSLQRVEDIALAERFETRRRPECNVNGTARLVQRPAAMGHRSTASSRFASGAGASPTPGANDELELCRSSGHLNGAKIITI